MVLGTLFMNQPTTDEMEVPERTLMGAGPSEVSPAVLQATSTPLVGHLDPAFLEIMDEVQDLLRYAFRTVNKWTLPVSGTGSAAMETAIGNVVEPGDTVLLPTNGYFGKRMEKMVERAGGEVAHIHADWGEPLDIADVESQMSRVEPDVFGFIHAETSTGILQPSVSDLTSIAHQEGAVVIADTVTSLGGVELRVDEWDIDVAYSGAQKCLSAPPGASPITLNDRAMQKVLNRESSTQSWYLDLSLLEGYWGPERTYHHTAPITNIYAIREALRRVAKEGISQRWKRHTRLGRAIKAGVEGMGLSTKATDDAWLPVLNAVQVPAGVAAEDVIEHLLREYNIEIAGGLGTLSGEIFRIGCMGYSCRPSNVSYLVVALADTLDTLGADIDPERGVDATRRAL